MNIFKKLVLIFATVIGISSLGVSSETSSQSEQELEKVTTCAMDYISPSENEDYYFKLSLLDNTAGAKNAASTVAELDATITKTGNTLYLSGMEPIAMSKLQSGDTSISMEYRFLDTDIPSDLLLDSEGTQDLGMIPFELSVDEPYWRISNINGQWGIGNIETAITSVVYELLPKNLGEMHGYNNITPYKKEAKIGTITIKQLVPITKGITEINLSSLGLSEEINQKIIANDVKSSSLEIMANYNFSVPFSLQVQGKATLIMYVNVIHDVKPLIKLKRNPKTYLLYEGYDKF